MKATAYEEIILSKEEGIATLTFNRPDRLNALTPRMLWLELPSAIEDMALDDDVRVVIVTGAGKGFCSGADIRGIAEGSGVEYKSPEPKAPRYGLIHRFRNLPKPTIAAINGVAAGAGFSWALLCDIRIASENARFSMAFVRRGLIPDAGGTFLLPRLVGTGKALELIYTGDIIDVSEAERIGLVNRVVPADDLMPVTRELAARIAKGPPLALASAKRVVYQWLEKDLMEQLEYEAYQQTLLRQTEDFQEGVKAFVEKREAIFRGK